MMLGRTLLSPSCRLNKCAFNTGGKKTFLLNDRIRNMSRIQAILEEYKYLNLITLLGIFYYSFLCCLCLCVDCVHVFLGSCGRHWMALDYPGIVVAVNCESHEVGSGSRTQAPCKHCKHS